MFSRSTAKRRDFRRERPIYRVQTPSGDCVPVSIGPPRGWLIFTDIDFLPTGLLPAFALKLFDVSIISGWPQLRCATGASLPGLAPCRPAAAPSATQPISIAAIGGGDCRSLSHFAPEKASLQLNAAAPHTDDRWLQDWDAFCIRASATRRYLAAEAARARASTVQVESGQDSFRR